MFCIMMSYMISYSKMTAVSRREQVIDYMKKKLPIGIENFCDIRTEGFYYVDKTGLIKELLDN